MSKYPWSIFSPKYLHDFAAKEPHQAVKDFEAELRGRDDKQVQETIAKNPKSFRRLLSTAKAMSYWLKGGRQLIRLSRPAGEALMDIGHTRWSSLPRPGEPLYAEPLMFWHMVSRGVPVMCMVIPYGDPLAPRVRATAWMGLPLDFDGETPVPGEHTWEPCTMPGLIDAHWVEANAHLIHQKVPEGMSADEHAIYMGKATGATIIHLVVNAIAAMGTELTIPILRQSKKQKKQSRKPLDGVRNVKTMSLDDNGLAVWKKRIVEVDRAEDYNRRGPDQKKRKSPCQYTVDGFTRKTWVRTPKKNERVVDEKPGKDGTLYAVMRPVRGWTTKGELRFKESRLKKGVDDIRTDT